eukprot:12904436-Prorocentrum_lima.AAC.1
MPQMSPAESDPAHPIPEGVQGGQEAPPQPGHEDPPPHDQGGQQVPPQVQPDGQLSSNRSPPGNLKQRGDSIT